MSRFTAKSLILNLLLLVFGAVPLVFFLVWLGNLLLGRYEQLSLGFAASSGYLYTVIYFLPVLVGGLIHQALVAALPPGWTAWKRRIAAVLLTVVIPVVLILFGQPIDVLGWFAIPITIALIAYGLLMRLPRDVVPPQGSSRA